MLTTMKKATSEVGTPTERRRDVPVRAARTLTSAALFGNGDIVCIQHNGMTYTLRKTRNGKLILTK